MAGTPAAGQRARCWTVERRVGLLGRVPPFARLPPAAIRGVAALFRPRDVPRGGFVFHEGEPASAGNVAAEGRIKIVRETGAGRQVILRLINPGEPFGLSGGWGAATYPASARALDDAVVLQLPAREFTRLLAIHPELALAVIEDLGARLREAESRSSISRPRGRRRGWPAPCCDSPVAHPRAPRPRASPSRARISPI